MANGNEDDEGSERTGGGITGAAADGKISSTMRAKAESVICKPRAMATSLICKMSHKPAASGCNLDRIDRKTILVDGLTSLKAPKIKVRI